MNAKTARSRQKEPGPDLEKEIEELKVQLDEAQQTLAAIRSGEVDALVVSTPHGDTIYTLRGAERPYRVIVENISEGAATLLPDGLILYANSAFADILNVPLERVIGMRFEEFVWNPDREAARDLFQRAFRETARTEISLKGGSGPMPVYISLRSLPLEDEKPGLSMVISDISERKRAEEELRRAHDELDARVHQRTVELKEANKSLHAEIAERKRAEDKLKDAVRNLEHSNRELEQFAYIASHDLQEPLRTVSSYVELLGLRYKGNLDEKADRYIAFAIEGANRMSDLINDLLAYSRVGTTAKNFGPVNTSAAVNRATAVLRRSMKESGTVITTAELPEVFGDESQIVQLFQNLIANAVKFRKQNVPPRIHIGAARQNNEWTFSVQDNGIGIEPRFRERIFTIFQRLHTREEYPGTGVGLAICKRIVERHGGRIWVESDAGKGSSFYFTIPDREASR
jgi:PAS domain S-box-containing protein